MTGPPENITKQGRQNDVQIAPAAPQIDQIKEQPPTIYLATTTGNGPTSTWRPSSFLLRVHDITMVDVGDDRVGATMVGTTKMELVIEYQ